jgi:hypothetical protein
VALGLTQSLTEMSIRVITLVGDKGGRRMGLTTLPPSCADCMELPAAARACTGITLPYFTSADVPVDVLNDVCLTLSQQPRKFLHNTVVLPAAAAPNTTTTPTPPPTFLHSLRLPRRTFTSAKNIWNRSCRGQREPCFVFSTVTVTLQPNVRQSVRLGLVQAPFPVPGLMSRYWCSFEF